MFTSIYHLLNNGTAEEKYTRIPQFPYLIDIELTNHCNFSCRMCETGMKTSSRARGYMDKDIYQKILSEAIEHKTSLRFIRWGEPTLHPDWLDYMIEAKKNGLLVHFNTNGYLLNENQMKILVEEKIDSIKFSFQGATAEAYKEMRNIDFFDLLLEKISILRKIRGISEFPKIQISTTVTTRDSMEEQEAFYRKTKEVADFVNIGITDLSKTKNMTDSQLSMVRPKSCSEVFGKLSVDWDGTVTSCCSDNNKLLSIGSLKGNSLSELWNSKKQKKIQKILSKNGFTKLPLCKDCYQTMPL